MQPDFSYDSTPRFVHSCALRASRFTGKERDVESGLEYFGARYYSSSMGRFSSPDPSGLYFADQRNPQSINLYSYVLNNPLRMVDPTGLGWCYYGDTSPGAKPSDDASDYDMDSPNAADCQGGQWHDVSASVDVNGNDGSGSITTIDTGMIPNDPLSTQNTVSINTFPTHNNFPCSGANNAQDPSWFADRGANAGQYGGVYADSKSGFPRGGVLDAQAQGRDPQTGQGGGDRPYGNYTYGAYMSATGVPLSVALFAANKYAHDSNAQYGPDITRDPKYGSLPQDNVANITNGYTDQRNGTLCHK